MKKAYIYILIIVALVIISPFVIKSDTKTFKVDGIKYAVSVNGEKWDSFPNKGSYNVNIECENAESSWNYQEWVAEIYNITGKVSCNISFTGKTKTTFATYIKNLLGTSTSVVSTRDPDNPDGSTLEKITDNGEEDYRYRGINPNNYVMFNNELWRIIGVFDDNTHSITDTHLVKIIRNDSIGGYVWDTEGSNGSNNFPNSDIYNILTAYYNHSYATGKDYCYSSTTSLKGKCDFTKMGIQTEYQNMVETSVNWFLGGATSAGYTSSEMYANERSDTTASSNYATTSASGKTVPVGLMYTSDYGYASPSSCTADLSGYNTEICVGSNWLKSNIYEWTITHSSNFFFSYYVFWVESTGKIVPNNPALGSATRPTLYLKSNVYYISGTGTQVDPYIINID